MKIYKIFIIKNLSQTIILIDGKKMMIKEYIHVTKRKLRKEKIKILNYLLSNINLKKRCFGDWLLCR